MKHLKVKQNFIYPEIPTEQYLFGSGKVLGTVLREDGDWRDFLPPEEDQNVRGVESSACYIEAQQHAIAILLEEQYGVKDQNFSARFNALLSGGTEVGGDPIKGAESIRKDGLVKQESMPWDGIDSFQEFHSWEGVDEKKVRSEGKEFLTKWKLNHDVVFTRNEAVEQKYAKLREALKYCPCPVSVAAWYQEGDTYYKPEGMRDNHMVTGVLVYIDIHGYSYIWDTYSPFLKKLAPNYNFDFAMRWTVSPAPDEVKKNLIQTILDWIKEQLGLIQKEIDAMPKQTKREQFRKLIEESVGKDLSPDNKATNEFGCSESLSNALNSVYSDFPKELLSTAQLAVCLDDSPHFERITAIEQADLIVSPRTYAQHGHCGAVLDRGTIVSNDSQTGLMQKNYTWDSWVNYFKTQKGLRVLLWRIRDVE